jgi:hypothetical protein
MKKLRKGDLVSVFWLDAYTAGEGWIDPEELGDRFDGGMVGGFSIPLGCIESVKKVR